MLKVICEFIKVDLILEDETYLEVLKLFNCQACDFNDLTLAPLPHNLSSLKREINAAHHLQGMHDQILPLYKSDFKPLADKLHYVTDYSPYRFIQYLDENVEVLNPNAVNKLPMIYSAVIRLLYDQNSKYRISTAWETLSSWWESSISNGQNPITINQESYKTIWCKIYFISFNNISHIENIPGIFNNALFDNDIKKEYFSVNPFFFKYLFYDKQNSICKPFAPNNNLTYIGDQNVYENFKVHLPKIMGLEWLHSLHVNRICILPNNTTLVMSDTNKKFVLDSKSDDIFDEISINLSICYSLGGVLQTIPWIVSNFRKHCQDNPHSIDINANELHSPLFELNCSTLEQVLHDLGDISALYPA